MGYEWVRENAIWKTHRFLTPQNTRLFYGTGPNYNRAGGHNAQFHSQFLFCT